MSVQRRGYGYETEGVTGFAGTQAIRTPGQVRTHRTATCIDAACLFAAMLEAAGQRPLLVVVDTPNGGHALAGYRVRDEPASEVADLADLRAAVTRGDAVFVEPTGAFEADYPVGAENASDRIDKVLRFSDAQDAASKLLRDPSTQLRHFVDVVVEHSRISPSPP